jgi:hypothetical protein
LPELLEKGGINRRCAAVAKSEWRQAAALQKLDRIGAADGFELAGLRSTSRIDRFVLEVSHHFSSGS